MVTAVEVRVQGGNYGELLERGCEAMMTLVGEDNVDAVDWDFESITAVESISGSVLAWEAVCVGRLDPREMS